MGQANEVFVGLRRLRQEVEYVRYLNEGHVVEAPANQKDFCERRIRWFDDHLNSPKESQSPNSLGLKEVGEGYNN